MPRSSEPQSTLGTLREGKTSHSPQPEGLKNFRMRGDSFRLALWCQSEHSFHFRMKWNMCVPLLVLKGVYQMEACLDRATCQAPVGFACNVKPCRSGLQCCWVVVRQLRNGGVPKSHSGPRGLWVRVPISACVFPKQAGASAVFFPQVQRHERNGCSFLVLLCFLIKHTRRYLTWLQLFRGNHESPDRLIRMTWGVTIIFIGFRMVVNVT